MISAPGNDCRQLEYRFRLAAVLSCMSVVLFFAFFSAVPFRVEGDIAYISKAAQQYVDLSVPFNQIRLADPTDLSRDIDTWIFWWPPFIYTSFVILLSLGLTVSFAARLLMFVAAVIGAIGWARASAMLLTSRVALLLSPLPPLIYVINNEMFDQFSSGDPIVFAIVPWLIVICLQFWNQPRWRRNNLALLLFGSACGALYWVKYSSLFLSAVLLLTLTLLLVRDDRSLKQMLRIGAMAIGCIVPIAILWLLNHVRGGDFLRSSIASAVLFEDLPSAFIRAGAMAVLPIDAGVERFLAGQFLSLAVRALGLLLAIVVVVEGWRKRGADIGVLASLMIVIPIAALGYLTWATGYHFLLDADRHAGTYWIFLQLMFIGVLAGDLSTLPGVRIVATGCGMILLAFVAFTPYVALRGGLSRFNSDRDSQTGLYDATLSATHSGALTKEIASHLRPDDLVIPATYWLGIETWLAFKQRLLPLTNFYQPLVATHGADGASYFALSPLLTKKPIRVVLILTDPYSKPDMVEATARIKGRFVQAARWSQINLTQGEHTAVWSAMLDPNFVRTDDQKQGPPEH